MPAKWLLLPFGGASGKGVRNIRGQRADAAPGIGGPTHESAEEFAKKSEEDIVEDYNAPMYSSLLVMSSPVTMLTY